MFKADLLLQRKTPPPHTHKTKPVMLYMYIQNFISKWRTIVTIIEKIHLEIIHNLVTENWEKFHAAPLPTHWSEESEQRHSWRTVPHHRKALSQGSASFVPKASATRGNGENLEPKYCHRWGFDRRALKYASTKEGKGDQATYEGGMKSPVSTSKNTGWSWRWSWAVANVIPPSQQTLWPPQI